MGPTSTWTSEISDGIYPVQIFFLCFTNTFHMFHSPKDLGKRWLHVRATLTHLSDSFVAALPGAPVLCSNPELPSHPGGLLTAGFRW